MRARRAIVWRRVALLAVLVLGAFAGAFAGGRSAQSAGGTIAPPETAAPLPAPTVRATVAGLAPAQPLPALRRPPATTTTTSTTTAASTGQAPSSSRTQTQTQTQTQTRTQTQTQTQTQTKTQQTKPKPAVTVVES